MQISSCITFRNPSPNPSSLSTKKGLPKAFFPPYLPLPFIWAVVIETQPVLHPRRPFRHYPTRPRRRLVPFAESAASPAGVQGG